MTVESETARERWHLAQVDDQAIRALAEELDLEYILAKILLARHIGAGDHNAIDEFLNPNEALATDYFQVTLPSELDKAVERVRRAIKKNEKIIVNGDPDADGICGAAILVAGLEALGARVEYYFPVRSREGHGLQVRIIEQAKKDGVNLIITTDCGSKDIKSAAYAKEQGIDVIVTDHHILGKEHPDVYAFINPNLVEEDTNFKTLSGSGVSLKFILAIYDITNQILPKSIEDFTYAATALGTLSDRMSMLNPMNRILVKKGVQAIQKTNWEGLKAIKRICHVDSNTLQPRDLSRSIIPRLNAPGRIGDPERGIPDSTLVVDMLLTGAGEENEHKASILSQVFADLIEKDKAQKAGDDEISREALSNAASVDDVNEQRKFMTNKIEEEIEELVEQQVDLKNDKVIIVQGKNWNSGVIGIDTDRLKDRHLRPAIIITKYDGNDFIRGSVRSIPNINMYGIIDTVGDIFQERHGRPLYQMEVESNSGEKRLVNAFGGHSQACGFSMHVDDIDEFKALIHEEAAKVAPEKWSFHFDIIDKLPFSQVGPKLLHQLEKLGPYGQRFEFPIFYLQGCQLSSGRPFGNKYQDFHKPHVNFKVIEKPKKKRKLPSKEFLAVGFGLWEKFCAMRSNLDPDMKYDVIFTIERDAKAKGAHKDQKIRLNVLDIRQSGDNVDSFMNPSSPED